MKVKFLGCVEKNFTDVYAYYDYSTDEIAGNVKIVNNKLYVKGVYIPIRSEYVKYALKEFTKCNNQKYADIEFYILPDGRYMVRRRSYANFADRLLGKIFDSTAIWEWEEPLK